MTSPTLPHQTLGIALGLGAGLLQAASYLGSRRFLTAEGTTPTQLFGLGHVQMGMATLVALPFLLPPQFPEHPSWLYYLLGSSLFYLCGQWLIFNALQHSDSSQVAPLLGFKIPILALFSSLLLGQGITPLGWLAVALCTTAGLLVSPPRGLPNLRVLALVGLGCLGYCGSDLCIPRLVHSLEPVSEHASPLALCLTYSFCSLVGLAVCIQRRVLTDLRRHRYALPYSVAWLLAMLCLFACFAQIGVVAGNILQSIRGILSVLLGMLISRAGLLHLENLNDKRIFRLRLAGAVLMTGAIVLYITTQKAG
jgi:uncharacterized membrane protein